MRNFDMAVGDLDEKLKRIMRIWRAASIGDRGIRTRQ